MDHLVVDGGQLFVGGFQDRKSVVEGVTGVQTCALPILLKGRPTSPANRLNSFPACGVKRRMARSRVSSRTAMLMLVCRLFRSALERFSSTLRWTISSLTVVNSSLADSKIGRASWKE